MFLWKQAPILHLFGSKSVSYDMIIKNKKEMSVTMDIQQLYYFMNIVECGCNLSLAAKKYILLNQP